MKNHKTLFAILLMPCLSGIAAEPKPINPETNFETSSTKKIAAKENNKPVKPAEKYSSQSGYEIDGSSSASKLAAKRSHSVSKNDETGLALFLGVIVIGLIVFFLKPFSDNK